MVDSKINCFVCASHRLDLSEETPYHWKIPRALCSHHMEACTLLNGERVYDFMERWTHNFPLEGNDLGFFINPVTVEGYRGWCDFLAGGMAVYEELFPSQSFFEFWTQHMGRLDLLYTLHLHRTEFAGDLFSALMSCLALNGRYPHDLSVVSSMWAEQREIAQMLLARGQTAVSSPNEILDLWHKMERLQVTLAPDSMQTFIPVLLDLAAVRFAHFTS